MFCSKCGRQINNDALFCTFCGSPTMLAAPSSPVSASLSAASDQRTVPDAPAPNVNSIPMPQSIPMSSESYTASGAWSASQSMPVPNSGYPAEAPFVEDTGSVDTTHVEEGTDSTVKSIPFAEELSPKSAESEENRFIYEPEQAENGDVSETAQTLRTERPFAPVQQTSFEVSGSTAIELSEADGSDFSAPIQIAQSIQPAVGSERPVKYYTFGHIALCLAAVGVMAVVAGVFAGLYFSVI